MQCPFCCAEIVADTQVCRTCNRDVAIPEALRKEREDLLRMRDTLRQELAEHEARLTRLRRTR